MEAVTSYALTALQRHMLSAVRSLGLVYPQRKYANTLRAMERRGIIVSNRFGGCYRPGEHFQAACDWQDANPIE